MAAAESPNDRLDAVLSPLRYHPEGTESREDAAFLVKVRVFPRAGRPEGRDAAALRALLAGREQALQDAPRRFYQVRRAKLVEESLRAAHSFQTLHAHTRLVDLLHRFVFDWATDEIPLLVALRRQEMESELTLAETQGAQKLAKVIQFREQLPLMLADAGEDREAKQYYMHVEEGLAREAEQLRSRRLELERALPALRDFREDAALFQQRLVVFARGGYGRGELSFASDLDTGYCIDARGLPAGSDGLLRELIVRMEALLHRAGLHTSHQYFEIDEDLSRFSQPQTQHTILSILESRALAGNPDLLRELQERFRLLVPFERLAALKMEEYESQPAPAPQGMNLKEDFGGLRSIQVPLWLVGLTFGARSYALADLLALAREKGLLSLRDVARLAQASALLYELRNFLGADEPAESHGAARLAPQLLTRVDEERYLQATRRHASWQALRRERMRLLTDAQRISKALMQRVLDRTVTHALGALRLTVHLSSKTITAIQAGPEAAEFTVSALLEQPANLLELFSYIAETGYDLTSALKDLLADLVARVAPARTPRSLAMQCAALNRIVAAPSAHRAVASLFDINDPLESECETLLGRFMPAMGRLFYQPGAEGSPALPAHEAVVRALAAGQRRLAWLRDAYPEWAPLLETVHIQGLKWSLLLHGLGSAGAAPEPPSRTAEAAAEALAAAGNRDETLEGLVRLLIQHHQQLAEITRTAAYLDQALAEYFEMAGRDVIKAILLFLVNVSVLESQPAAAEQDVDNLVRFFDEAMKILAGLRAIPSTDRSLELINVYLDGKKRETESNTRLHVLLNRSLAQGLHAAVYAPLRKLDNGDWKRMAPEAGKLERLHQQIVLGRGGGAEQEKLVERLLQALRHHLSPASLDALTSDEVIGWLFASFPNRYLLRTPPAQLARLIVKFAEFRAAPVLADVVLNRQGAVEGLLIAVRQLGRPHTRVAYALGLKRINILSGKVNPVDFGGGETGYCYYFEVASLLAGQELHPRDLEALILEDSTAERALPRDWFPVAQEATRLRFLEDDGKGYEVARERDGFARRPVAFRPLRVVRRDEPFLFHRLCRAFDSFGVEWRQALITTTGNLVVDYFSLRPADAERLQAGSFERELLTQVDTSGPRAERAGGA